VGSLVLSDKDGKGKLTSWLTVGGGIRSVEYVSCEILWMFLWLPTVVSHG